jgi:hypothetical protein
MLRFWHGVFKIKAQFLSKTKRKKLCGRFG